MIILHGIYDNGKVEIREKDLPKMRVEIEITLPEEREKRDMAKEFESIHRKMTALNLKLPEDKDIDDFIDGVYNDIS
ncbi:MAG: hypothetical protein HPY53_12690 [Brevinematales bacterium]|nr:hypothetical protein [Brevinematales bacterium]